MGQWQSQPAKMGGQKLHIRPPIIPDDVMHYKFPFENLAIEGGGTKTFAFLGAAKVLEEIGVLQQIKRFAGTSGGAILCALLAAGCEVDEVYETFSVNLTELSSDASYGWWSFLPNLYNRFGWHPGERVRTFIRQKIQNKCGDGDLTFKQLYKSRGVELCICVSNISSMSLEYCHPKTTPNMPIVDAVRMSMSLPAFFQPVVVNKYGRANYYIDGGLLCNYPLYVFDGWYLSMNPQDAFLNKLGGEELPFDGYNDKTIGMLVYATGDPEMYGTELHARYEGFKLERPDSDLARNRAQECDDMLDKLQERTKLVQAAKRFWRALHRHDVNRDGQVSLQEFFCAVKEIDQEDLKVLFNKNYATEKDFKELDENKDGKLTYREFVRLMDEQGMCFRETMEGSAARRDLTSIGAFSSAILDTMSMTFKKLLLKPRDVERTIGVHSDYVGTTDFSITGEDKEFLVKSAEYATIAFLKDYIQRQSRQQMTPE